MRLLVVIENRAVSFYPGVGLKHAIAFTRSNAQRRGNSLALEQPPQRERLLEAGWRSNSIPGRGSHHAHCSMDLARFRTRSDPMRLVQGRKNSLQRRVRSAESANR